MRLKLLAQLFSEQYRVPVESVKVEHLCTMGTQCEYKVTYPDMKSANARLLTKLFTFSLDDYQEDSNGVWISHEEMNTITVDETLPELRIVYLHQVGNNKEFIQPVPDVKTAAHILSSIFSLTCFMYDNRFIPDYANIGDLVVKVVNEEGAVS